MKFKIQTANLIIAMVMVVGVFLSISNESNAQGVPYKVGDRGPAGGWVFYDKGNSSNGWRYLEAAPVDQSDGAAWVDNNIMSSCCLFPAFYTNIFFNGRITGARGTAIGTGKSNTMAIVKSWTGEHPATELCLAYRGGGKNDWFLPSRDELNLMYVNLKTRGVGNFSDKLYWSSSEYYVSSNQTFSRLSTGYDWDMSKANGNNAWYQSFYNGYNSFTDSGEDLGWRNRNTRSKGKACSVRAIRAFDGFSEQTINMVESVASEIELTNRDLLLDVDYSGYDTLAKLKAKNPDITFSQIKYPGDNKGRTQFKTVLGQFPITTEATFTFNSKGRLGNVIIKKKGAALNVYEPLVEKYTQIYGNPKSSTPFTTDLRQNASFATCSFENDKRDTLLLLVIPFDDNNVPSILLVENWKDKY